jgi:hypothetical protein
VCAAKRDPTQGSYITRQDSQKSELCLLNDCARLQCAKWILLFTLAIPYYHSQAGVVANVYNASLLLFLCLSSCIPHHSGSSCSHPRLIHCTVESTFLCTWQIPFCSPSPSLLLPIIQLHPYLTTSLSASNRRYRQPRITFEPADRSSLVPT